MNEENYEDGRTESFPLKRYVAVLFRYRVLITSVVSVVTFLGVVSAILFIRPMNVWDGVKVIRVRSPWNELEALTGDPNAAPRREAFYVEAEIEQFYDQTILGEVVDRCGLARQQKELYKQFCKTAHGRIQKWLSRNFSFIFGEEEPTESEYREAAIRVLGKSLTVEPTTLSRRSSPVLSVQYYNPDPQKVPQVIETLLAVYQEHKKKDFAEGRAARKSRELFELITNSSPA